MASPAAGAGTSTRRRPASPSDTGSAFLDGSGQALGVLSTLEGLPRPVSNHVTDLGNALACARAHGFSGVSPVDGNEPFSGVL